MQSRYPKPLLVILTISLIGLLNGCHTDEPILWQIDSLTEIGGHPVTVSGNPQLVDTELGTAVQFDGEEDLLLVDHNPIGGAKEFTVEVLFKQAPSYPYNTTPRFIHIQDPEDQAHKRLMIELRVNAQNMCYMDAYLNTDLGGIPLMDSTLLHHTNKWQHIAVTYQDSVLSTYFNGKKELNGKIGYHQTVINPKGKVSIGGRMNHKHYFQGQIKALKVSKRALEPAEFMRAQDF